MTDAEMIESFERPLKADPNDRLTRAAYADWLDEHDRPEEADWQRRWPLSEIEDLKGRAEEAEAEAEHLRERGEDWGCPC